MRVAQHTIWIDRPRQVVFDYFRDFSKASEWRQYVVSMAQVDDSPLGVGSRFRADFEVNGAHQSFDMEVLAFDPPALWRHRTFESDFKGYVEYRFEPEGQGTRVTLTIEAKPATWYGWLGLPVMALQRNKPYRDQLPQLKRSLENPQ
jgi:uncharacterized membrane protein